MDLATFPEFIIVSLTPRDSDAFTSPMEIRQVRNTKREPRCFHPGASYLPQLRLKLYFNYSRKEEATADGCADRSTINNLHDAEARKTETPPSTGTT